MGITILKHREGYTIPLSSRSHRLAGRFFLTPELGCLARRCNDPRCLKSTLLIRTSVRFLLDSHFLHFSVWLEALSDVSASMVGCT